MLFEHGAETYQPKENHLPNTIRLRVALDTSRSWLMLCRALCWFSYVAKIHRFHIYISYRPS